MLFDISLVTVLCSSTAAAVEVTYSLTLVIACLIAVSAPATSPEMALRLAISSPILSGACLAWHGLVGREDPDLLADLADALVLAGLIFAAIQLRPELAIRRAVALGLRHEHAVMLALDLIQGIT